MIDLRLRITVKNGFAEPHVIKGFWCRSFLQLLRQCSLPARVVHTPLHKRNAVESLRTGKALGFFLSFLTGTRIRHCQRR
jgi:hypothetical protein